MTTSANLLNGGDGLVDPTVRSQIVPARAELIVTAASREHIAITLAASSQAARKDRAIRAILDITVL